MSEIFVFGSNLAGRHGKGAALFARKHYGAIYGVGVGIQGNSYAIPTKDENLKVLSIREISYYVSGFIKYAHDHPELEFHVTNIGCGLAGYTNEQMAPLFIGASNNCKLSDEWNRVLGGIHE